MDPLAMDWSAATADLYNQEANTVVHVFNHDLTSPGSVERNLRFAIARIRWFKRHIPAGCTQGVMFDDRGQRLLPDVLTAIRDALAPHVVRTHFMSEKMRWPST
jgi:hypothetical protein